MRSKDECDGGDKLDRKTKILSMCVCVVIGISTTLIVLSENVRAVEEPYYLESGYSKYAILIAPIWDDTNNTLTEILNTYEYLNSSNEWSSSNMVLLTENSSKADDNATYLNIKKALDDLKIVCDGDEQVFIYLCDTGQENYLNPEYEPGNNYYFMSHSDVDMNEPHPWREDNFASEVELISCSEMTIANRFSFSGGFGETIYDNNTALKENLFVCCSHLESESTENNNYSIYDGLIDGDNGNYGTTPFEGAHLYNDPTEGQTPMSYDNNEENIFPINPGL